MKKLIVLFLITLIGCGPEGSENQASLLDLEDLMEKNPELKKASLQQIKTAAKVSKVKLQALALQTTSSAEANNLAKPETTEPTTVTLDPEVAKKAQSLIDDVLDKYSVKKEFDAGIKVFAIFMKTQKAQMDVMKDLQSAIKNKKSAKFQKNDKFDGLDNKWDDENNPFNMKCEDVITGNFAGVPVNKIGDLLEANKTEIKKHLSGCAKIHGEKFVRCITQLNTMTNIINENVTCDVKDLNEMQSLIEDKSQMSFTELQDQRVECEGLFKKCGYIAKKTESLINNGN